MLRVLQAHVRTFFGETTARSLSIWQIMKIAFRFGPARKENQNTSHLAHPIIRALSTGLTAVNPHKLLASLLRLHLTICVRYRAVNSLMLAVTRQLIWILISLEDKPGKTSAACSWPSVGRSACHCHPPFFQCHFRLKAIDPKQKNRGKKHYSDPKRTTISWFRCF